jgi:hypothetical protein
LVRGNAVGLMPSAFSNVFIKINNNIDMHTIGKNNLNIDNNKQEGVVEIEQMQ